MKLRAILLAIVLSLGPSVAAEAALPPEAYEQLRQQALVVLVGVVQQDDGGRAWVRIEQVLRGQYAPGATVAVMYPENRGQEIPAGADIYYQRFPPGLRLRVFAAPSTGVGPRGPYASPPDPTSLAIVAGGIDVLGSAGPPPKSGGCGACALRHERDRGALALGAAALALALSRRRR